MMPKEKPPLTVQERADLKEKLMIQSANRSLLFIPAIGLYAAGELMIPSEYILDRITTKAGALLLFTGAAVWTGRSVLEWIHTYREKEGENKEKF